MHTPDVCKAPRPSNCTLLQTEEAIVHKINEARRQFQTRVHTHCSSQSGIFSLTTHAIKPFKRANERGRWIKRGSIRLGPSHFSVSSLEKKPFRLYFKHQARATDERWGEKRKQVRTKAAELTVKRDLQQSLSWWDVAQQTAHALRLAEHKHEHVSDFQPWFTGLWVKMAWSIEERRFSNEIGFRYSAWAACYALGHDFGLNCKQEGMFALNVAAFWEIFQWRLTNTWEQSYFRHA